MDATFVSVTDQISRQAKRNPQHIAVVDGKASITYGELEKRADALAGELINAGAQKAQCAALWFERSGDFVIAALAVLKTGAAYLPLDSSIPIDRLTWILSDSGASVLLSHRNLAATISVPNCHVLNIDKPIAKPNTGNVTANLTSQSLAYLVYTSGSTGQPKGVEITQGNLCNLIDWHNQAFAITAADHASHVAGLGFDAAAWEIWPHLCAGACLHIADDTTRRSPHLLRDWLVAQKITVAFVPTILAEQLLQTDWPKETALRFMLTGADTLHRRPAGGLPFALVNNYGPSECTVVATSGLVAPQDDAHAQPSIGRPIANATVLILDENLQCIADGEAGELCVAGALVGRGYRNQPRLTAEKFVMYTPPTGEPMRIYRTGDRARRLANGEIAFLGRLDDQIKLRGYRIELGEIVAHLDRYPGIDASAVVLRQSSPAEEARLVAYLAMDVGKKISASDLRTFLSTRLPDYMIPAQFVRTPSLPLTANSKLDRSLLPEPTSSNLLLEATPAPAASSTDSLREQLGAMIASLLGTPSVENEANFFMIGGHSMFGVQLVARIRDTFGVKLSLRQLFSAPTVAALSTEIAKLTAA